MKMQTLTQGVWSASRETALHTSFQVMLMSSRDHTLHSKVLANPQKCSLEFLSLIATLDILGWMTLCGGGLSSELQDVYFNSTPDLCPLDASSQCLNFDNQNCLQTLLNVPWEAKSLSWESLKYVVSWGCYKGKAIRWNAGRHPCLLVLCQPWPLANHGLPLKITVERGGAVVEAFMPTPQIKTLRLGQEQPGLPPGRPVVQESPPPSATELPRSVISPASRRNKRLCAYS